MCAILDANVVGDVFGGSPTLVGADFLDWLDQPGARLALGGKLLDELANHASFEKWAAEAIVNGRVRYLRREQIETAEASLPKAQIRSNDPHVIALARVSGARILYSRDGDLCDDFRNPRLVPKPRGRILPSGESANARRHRRTLLNRADLCPNR